MIYGSWYKNMENLANIIIQVGIARQIHQFHFTCRVKLNIHYFSRFFQALMFLLLPVLSAGIEGWSQENPNSAWKLGLEKMINPLEEEEGMWSVSRCEVLGKSLVHYFWFIMSLREMMMNDIDCDTARHHVIFTSCVHRKLTFLLSSSFTQT